MKWEYLVHESSSAPSPADLAEVLNVFGEDGWELAHSSPDARVLAFKRPKDEDDRAVAKVLRTLEEVPEIFGGVDPGAPEGDRSSHPFPPEPKRASEMETCGGCGGKGWETVGNVNSFCPHCNGTGLVPT